MVRDTIHNMARHAGVVSLTEEHDQVQGSNHVPGDVTLMNIGPNGEDKIVDVTIVSSHEKNMTKKTERERMYKIAAAARNAEKNKRMKRPGGSPGPTMQQIIRSQGQQFYPIGFETYGASTPQLTALLKKLGEEAVRRRGRHKMSFIRFWKTELAMTIARRGAQVAVRRASAIKRNTFTDHEYEQLSLESPDILEDTDVLLLQDVQSL